MPPVAQQITSWSYSRYNAYRQCPFKARQTILLKQFEPGSPAMERGSAIHKMVETYIGKTGRVAFPEELKLFKTELQALRTKRRNDEMLVSLEETWAFRKDWTETVYNDWNGCWLRVKTDISYLEDATLYIVDIKTGKFSPAYNLQDYLEQLELYALAGLLKYADIGPELRVRPQLWYIDHKIIYPSEQDVREFQPSDVPALKKKWASRVKPMLNDKKFAPNPNRFCGNCYFRKENKGPCEY